LIEAGQHILARAQISIGPGPHIPAGLGRDDEFVAVGKEILLQDLAESFFRRSVGRAVIIGEIEMRDAEIEGAAQHGAGIFKVVYSAEVVPQSERNGGKLNAAAPRAAILHGIVTLVICYIHAASPSAPKGAFLHAMRSACLKACPDTNRFELQVS